MKTERIKQLIQEKKWSLLVSEFSDFDKNSTSINQLQKSCGLPLDSKRILKAVEVIENVRGDLKDVYGRISAFLYPD